jgi:Alpha amylase, catalytic domain/FlgD Ig-like domain
MLSPMTYGQMVTTIPAVPTMGKLIKIFYDSSQDPGTLHNYTGDIYAHTGVILKGNSSWQKVIGTWANNSTQPKLSKVNTYLYELDITPEIKTFYSLASTDTVTKIALVFRNDAGTLQTSPDIFLDIFQVGLNCTFTLPAKPSLVVEINKQISVSVSATLADSLSLYINNQFIKKSTNPDLLTYTITANQYGEYWVKAVAWDKPKFAADSFFFYVRKPEVVEALPANVVDGINYSSDTSVTLVLQAPYKNHAFVVGDFNGWLAREAGYMKVTPDSVRYWIKINGLKPQKEYRFQYLVDTSLYIADPYADKVLDPDNDQFITSVTYPNLIQYPKDTASGIVSVLQTAQTPYNWKTTSFQPPQKNKLVIYELLVRDFTLAHDFKTLTDTLHYLTNLGINAIELMPVCEFEGNLSWGYNPSFYFASDKYYGPKNSYKAFVDTCHSRGIAVIMDIVLNHCFGQSPFVQLYLDHYATDEIIMKLPNPWFNAQSPNTTYKWGADFNHESPSTQNLVDRILAYWMTEYKIDGFRFDFSKGFTNTPGDGYAYDASRIAILKRMADKIWTVNPKAYVILEHFTANSEESELANYGMMLWGNMNNNYTEAAMGYASDLSGASSLSRVGWTVPNLVSYMESHDEERMMYKTETYGASSGNYNTKDLLTALNRMELATVFFLSIPGPKMIWQFGELGYDISIDFGGRTSNKPILWNYFTYVDRYRLYQTYKIMNQLRKTQDVFSTNDYLYSLDSPQKSIHLNSSGMKVNILGNFDVNSGTIIPAFSQTGKWYEYFTDDSITVSAVNAPINLQPGEYRLYSTIRMKSPKLLLGIKDETITDSKNFLDVYPNPSPEEFTIEVKGLQPAPATISILDISGRVIRQIKSDIVSEGPQLFKWNGKMYNGVEAGKGIYFIQVQIQGRIETVKIIKE